MPSPSPEPQSTPPQSTPPQLPPVRLAIIGLGVIGRRMLEQAALQPALQIAGVWDLDPLACQRAQADFPGTVIAASARALIADAGVDLVYIGTPPAFHREYALLAAAHGKHVFCEKPLTTELDQAHRLVTELAQRETPNAVNFVFASAPSADWLASRLADGAIGEVTAIDMRLFFARWPRDWQASAAWLSLREQGGFVREVLSHFVYLSLRLFGDCRLQGAQIEWPADPRLCERAATALLSCAGIPVTVSAAASGAGPDEVVFTIRGTKGALRLSNWYEAHESDGAAWRAVSLPVAPYADMRVAAYQAQLANLVRFARDLSHPLPDAAVALQVQEVIEGMLGTVS